MTLAVHGHHILLIATLAFVAAVLTPNWYTSAVGNAQLDLNIFQICKSTIPSSFSTCEWTFSPDAKNLVFNDNVKILYPILTASFALVCAGFSFIALLLGSCYIHQYASGTGSKWLIVCTMLATLFSFLFSCGVWAVMLTTNLQQKVFGTSDINIKDFGFSFWINIGSSGVYLYALLIYLIIICKS